MRQQLMLLVVMATLALSCGRFSDTRLDPPDFQAYVAEVRKVGMAESAKEELSMVATIRTGGTLLSFSKDESTGRYDRSYLGTACPVPGADPDAIRRWQEELQDRVQRDMLVLRKYADRDGSGFVSTNEGRDFRDLVEFGYLAVHIAESEPATGAALARAANLPADRAAARVAQYNALAKQLNSSSEFKLPLVDLAAAAHRAGNSGPGDS